MKASKQEYRQFLQSSFSKLKLRKPLFYNWHYGLRFDLQKEGLGDDEYFAEVARRAVAIFETAFEASDRLFFVFKDYRKNREKIRISNYAFQQIDKLAKDEICYTKERSLYDPDDIFNVALINLTADRINYRKILTAIGHTDFPPRQPRLDNKGFLSSKEIYFANIGKKLIFHMYDDRGLDIIAGDKKTLRPIHKKHNEWILDYDREKIDGLFDGQAP